MWQRRVVTSWTRKQLPISRSTQYMRACLRQPIIGQLLLVTGMLFACQGLAAPRVSPSCQGLPIPMEPSLSRQPGLVRDWAVGLLADDPKVRATTAAILVQGGTRSLPLLKHLLGTGDEHLLSEAVEIVHRIGPAAIPLLLDMLRDERASVRRQAIVILINLAPDTASTQPALRRALKDKDSLVAGDAARALGALGEGASHSVSALVKALAYPNPHVRLYVAEALASIGPAAASATKPLAKALRDPIPGVRWGACEALASIGPAAAPAVPELIEALKDEFLYVRICAAGALGSLGPKAATAIDPLRGAASDPTLRAEVEWALARIEGVEGGEQAASPTAIAAPVAGRPQRRTGLPSPAESLPMNLNGLGSPLTPSLSPSDGERVPFRAGEGFRGPRRERPVGGDLTAGVTPSAGDPMVDGNTSARWDAVWSVLLGDQTFGRPVVCGDVVYVGTDNARRMDPTHREECGVLMAVRATDGAFLWQDLAPRVDRGLREFLLPSTTSAPYVEGNRLYYVTAECQLRCLDTQGSRDASNRATYQVERSKNGGSANRVWELDMCGRLGVFPHEACNSEVLPAGDLLIVCTSNGRNEGHTRVPSPRAPSLIAVDKRTGEVVWRAVGPGAQILHGQWCSPAAADVSGRVQVLLGGGDGWLRAYDAASGREIWRFDGNPKDARWLPRPGVFSRSPIVAAPVYDDGRVFLAMGQDPSHGNGPSLLHAVSPNGQGDVTDSRRLWTSREVGWVVGTPAVRDGLLYVGDLGGSVCCLDAATGRLVWKHDTNGAIWGCLVLAGDRCTRAMWTVS